jgi:hypothetical protein
MRPDTSELRLEDYVLSTTPTVKKKTRKMRRKAGEFLRGPIPWLWIKSAAKTKGSTLFVALAVRHFCDLMKRRTINIALVDLGCGVVSRHTVSRALKLLQSRGLIELNRRSGRLLAITILEVPADP